MTAVKKEKRTDKAAKEKQQRLPTEASLKRRQRNVVEKRKLIMQAALTCFSKYGLHGTSIDQIANLADISKTNLFYYFNNKEELYVTLLSSLLDLWLEPLRAFKEDQNPIDAIKDYIRLKLVFSRDHPAESRLFCLEVMQGAPLLIDELQQPLHDLVADKIAVIHTWIKQGKLVEVDPKHLIFSIWATTQHYADFRIQVEAVAGKNLDDPLFFQETLTSLETIIFNGIRPR